MGVFCGEAAVAYLVVRGMVGVCDEAEGLWAASGPLQWAEKGVSGGFHAEHRMVASAVVVVVVVVAVVAARGACLS